jgi:5-methyltetrahydrofolate--homocysteine methyltransferase
MRIQDLIAERVVFFDGASGTMLQSAGLPAGMSPDLWNMERADTIRDMHRRYLDAGSDVISTVTFRAGTFDADDARQIVAAAVQNCREAIDSYRADGAGERPVFTALDIGPSGKLVGIAGGPDFSDAYEYFRAQVTAGADAGADIILFETFTDVYELKAAVLAAQEHTSLPILATVTFEAGGRTMMGTDPETATLTFCDRGLTAFGVNCSLGPHEMLPALRGIARYATAPIMAQPNAGLPRLENGVAVYDITPMEFAAATLDIVNAGARVVGGCCGTTPEYIEAFIGAVNSQSENPHGNIYANGSAESYPSVCATGAHIIIGPECGYSLRSLTVTDADPKQIQSSIKKLAKETDLIAVEIDASVAEHAEAIAASASSVARAPVAFKCADAAALDRAIRVSRGKPAVILPSGNKEIAFSCAETAKKYGTAVIIEGAAPEAETFGLAKDRIIVADGGLLSPYH